MARARLLLLILAVALLAPARAEAQPLERIRLQLRWTHQFQFAGYYVALERGYYRSAGLDVELVPGAPGIDAADEVLSERADAGVGTTELLLRFAQGADVVVLTQIFQHSPFALAVRTDHGVHHVHDLVGKRIMVEPGAAEIRALLAREGLRPGDVTIMPHPFSIKPFADGDVDGATVYASSEPFQLDHEAVPYLLLDARSAGIDFYGDNLFTRGELAQRKPAAIAGLRDASLRGWREALADPEAAIQLIRTRWNPGADPDFLRYEAAQTIKLVRPDSVELGYQFRGRWEHIGQTYAELGMLPATPNLDGFLWEPETRQALPRWVRWALAALAVAGVIALAFILVVTRSARRAEQAERRLRELIDGAPVPIVVVDSQDHRVRYANTRAAVALGRSREKVTKLRASDLYADPEAREKLLRDLDEHGVATDQEIQLTRADGTPFWVLVSSRRSDFEGRPSIISGFIDLTDQKQLETDLRSALDQVRLVEGILPICMHCKKIKDDVGAWQPLEHYISARSDAQFSHGLCPECLERHYPEDEKA
jgi:PAS domain S-box-containing protein